MLERIPKRALNFFAGRVIDNLVELQSNKDVDRRIQQLIAEGRIPIVYANHQGHFDGVAIPKISSYLRGLTGLQGLAVIFAKSMITGHQSEELKSAFDLLIGGGRQSGVEPVPVTREKDQIIYGLSRLQIAAELRPLIRSLRRGFGMAIFPEGSVQGGCHPKGAGIEDIYGMQEIDNDNLIDFFQLVSKIGKGKKPFFMPVGLHGSFRIMQKEGGKPKLTPSGVLSLIAAATGLPFGLRIQANLLMPFTREEIAADLGMHWMLDSTALNRYAMERIAVGVPDRARGVYPGY